MTGAANPLKKWISECSFWKPRNAVPSDRQVTFLVPKIGTQNETLDSDIEEGWGPSVSPVWDFYVLCLKTRSRYQLRPRNPSVTGLLRWDWWRGDHPRDNLNQATPEILMKSTAGLSRELWVGPRFESQSFSGFCIISNPWVLINSINLLAIRVFYISQKELIYLKRCLTLKCSF